MDLTDLLFIIWSAVATATALHYRARLIEGKALLRASMILACNLTKDEKLRKEFETNVVDKIIQANQ